MNDFLANFDIGLGDMGQVIIPRLIESGHKVVGWNRTPGKWRTPAEACEGAQLVLIMVKFYAYMDMSTISPDVSREIAMEFKNKELIFDSYLTFSKWQ